MTATNEPLCGVLVVDKPAGMTSAAVVAQVKRALGVRRIGHTGTLDPMATGVLPLCVGEATKIAGYLLAEDKVYAGELELGVQTDTLDAEGAVTASDPAAAAAVTADALAAAAARFVGPGQQVPPMYSALKRDGKRLHALARAGQVVDRPPRPIVIHRLDIEDLQDLQDFQDFQDFQPPRVRFTVHCSKGTYVRSLTRDLGHALGCGAHLTALRRLRAGDFDITQSIQLSDIKKESASLKLVDPAAALPHLRAATVPADRVAAIVQGKPLAWSALSRDPAPDGVARLLTPDGALLALVEVQGGRLRYRRVFTYGLTNRARSFNLCGSKTQTH